MLRNRAHVGVTGAVQMLLMSRHINFAGFQFNVPTRELLRVKDGAGSEMCLPAGEAGALQANAASPSAQGLSVTPKPVAATSSPQSAMAAVQATAGDRRARHWRFAAAAMVAVLCSAAVAIHWRSLSSDESGLRAEPRRLSIVALPFVNAS